MKPLITPQQRRAARALVRKQKSPREALAAAGYSPSTAQRGAHQILDSAGLRLAVLEEIRKHRKIALPTPDEQADFVRWRLLINALQGKDAAPQSLKMLGQDRRVNMWTPETPSGTVILIQPPRELMEALARRWREDSLDTLPEPG